MSDMTHKHTYNSLGGFRDLQGGTVGSINVFALIDSTREIKNIKQWEGVGRRGRNGNFYKLINFYK